MKITKSKFSHETSISFHPQFNYYSWGGVDYGYKPECLGSNEKYIIMKTKGNTAWSSVGETEYYPPQIFIFRRVATIETSEMLYKERVILEVSIEEYGRKWKKAKEEAFEYIENNRQVNYNISGITISHIDKISREFLTKTGVKLSIRGQVLLF